MDGTAAGEGCVDDTWQRRSSGTVMGWGRSLAASSITWRKADVYSSATLCSCWCVLGMPSLKICGALLLDLASSAMSMPWRAISAVRVSCSSCTVLRGFCVAASLTKPSQSGLSIHAMTPAPSDVPSGSISTSPSPIIWVASSRPRMPAILARSPLTSSMPSTHSPLSPMKARVTSGLSDARAQKMWCSTCTPRAAEGCCCCWR
mmetsp:Transcript_20357/g.49518  ORF Transcript_20357/g.49518 Transcript_20357/m.49518 type:complete len:204 (+) Transcript_20357:373-984(+)